MFTLLFVTLFLAGWLLCAFIPWLALSVKTRGHAGLRYLPLCLFTGLVAALAVPVFGLDDGTGLVLSFAAAFAASALLLAARRLSLPRAAAPSPAHPEPGDAPR